MKKIFLLILLVFHITLPMRGALVSDSVIQDTIIPKMRNFDFMESYRVNLPQVIPSSPQSQVFERYINHEITEYNGLPNIEIPLYEVKIKGLTIPISLSYHAGGIKFKQYDGDIAAGWSINAGGYRVSRTILGKPDEKYDIHSEGYLDTLYSAPNDMDHRDDMYFQRLNHVLSDIERGPSSTINEEKYKYDSERDLFSYLLPSANGNFIITSRDKKEVATFEQNLDKIIIDPNTYLRLDDIQITDQNGFLYLMGKSSDGILLAETDNTEGKNKTAWPVNRIQSPHNEVINFEYEEFKNVTTSYQDGLTYYVIPDAGVVHNLEGNIGRDCHTYAAKYATYYTYESYANYESYRNLYSHLLLISKIKTEQVDVEFYREKLVEGQWRDPHRLREIRIKDKNGKLMKTIQFNYRKETPYEYHTFLTSIILKGKDSNKQEYKFDYYYPEKGTQFIADQWGYYKSEDIDGNCLWGISNLFFHNEMKDDTYLSCYYSYNATHVTPVQDIKKVGDMVPKSTWSFYNRSTNPIPYHFSLKEITFPTGGTTTYEYESNRYRYKDEFNQYKIIDKGGGQRIFKIISDTKDGSSPAVTTVFKYGENEDDFGISNFWVDYNMFKRETASYEYRSINELCKDCENCVPKCTYAVATIMRSFHTENISAVQSCFSVKYPYVTTYKYNNDGTYKGKVLSEYYIQEQHIVDAMRMVSEPSESLFPLIHNTYHKALGVKEYCLGYKPLLERKFIYNENNHVVKFEEFTYKKISPVKSKYTGLKVLKNVENSVGKIWESITGLNQINIEFVEYDRMRTETVLGTDILIHKYVEDYDVKGNSYSFGLESYIYDEKHRLVKTQQRNSRNNYLTKEFIYPVLGSALERKNMVSTIVETVTSNNDEEIGRIKNVYDNYSIYPSMIQSSASGIDDLQTDIVFDKYDDNGNILQYTTLNGISTIYVWSYNNQYPIAEIKNVTYEQVENAAKSAFGLSNMKLLANMKNVDEAKLKNFHLQLSSLNGVFVTTHTYKPLVGMSSTTDPRGVTTYYEYDDFNRLKRTYIKEDGVEKTLQSHDYHYRNN